MENGENTRELCTLNEICRTVGGNYKTVQKIVNDMVEKNLLEVGTVNIQNRDYTAYYVDGTIFRKIQNDLKNIKKNTVQVRKIAQVQSGINTNHDVHISDFIKNDIKSVDNLNILKQNADLSHKVEILEARNKELELEKLHELSKLREEQAKELAVINGEKVQLQADNYKLQADIKLIEDKSRTMESAYSEQKLKVEALEKVVKSKDRQLLITGAVLLVVIVVIACYFLFARL